MESDLALPELSKQTHDAYGHALSVPGSLDKLRQRGKWAKPVKLRRPSNLKHAKAAFLRNGTAKAVMGLSKAESTRLWEGLSFRTYAPRPQPVHADGVKDDFEKFWNINDKLISESSGPLRSFALRVYVPSTPRVVQQPVPLLLASSKWVRVPAVSVCYLLLPQKNLRRLERL